MDRSAAGALEMLACHRLGALLMKPDPRAVWIEQVGGQESTLGTFRIVIRWVLAGFHGQGVIVDKRTNLTWAEQQAADRTRQAGTQCNSRWLMLRVINPLVGVPG